MSDQRSGLINLNYEKKVRSFSREIMFYDYSLYRDQYGLQQPTMYGTSHNGVRFTAQFVLVMINYGCLTYGQKLRLRGLIGKCFEKPGLLRRDPSSVLQDSIDNYLGLALISKFIDQSWAKDVLKYGRSHFGFYENNKTSRWPKGSAFLWRFPQLFYALRCAAGERPNWFQTLSAVISIWAARNTMDQDRRALSLLLIRCGDGHSKLINWAAEKFAQGFKKSYPEGLGQVLGDYYQNHDHPDASYLRYIYR